MDRLRRFYDSLEALLGHKGFLNVFTATFDGRAHHLDLIPNGTAPPPVHNAA